MKEFVSKIQALKDRLAEIGKLLHLPQLKQRLLELEDKMQAPDFWQDQQRAKEVSQQAADLKEEVTKFEKLTQEIDDSLIMAGEIEESGENFLSEELDKKITVLEKEVSGFEFRTILNGEYDGHNALVAIHAGTGGTDAQDWAEMLERMYLRYAERKKFRVNILDRQPGNEAGLKSVIFEVLGKWAYGYLKSEAGVHRLVRISPFDAEKMRHTSFALMEVLPELAEVGEVEFKDEDLEVDVFRSSGHGGQSVNTTDSAVRIRHKPTGIVVTCQNQRSQLQNKQTALKILAARVKQYNQAEKEEEKKKLRGEFSEAAWGNQIRSYVLQPYKLVKDHRTEYETQTVEKVLNGELDELVEAYLKGTLKH